MTKLVAYLAHPVSSPTVDGVRANLDNARAWLKFLVDVTPWAICAPWIPYVEQLPDTPGNPYRDRGLADDVEMLCRCDLIVLVGGVISRGMEIERNAAVVAGLAVCDLSYVRTPPTEWGAAMGHILEVIQSVACTRALAGA